MGKVISIANQKGGVGKTTTVVNLAASLALLDHKILIIDCDPQGNATSGLGIDKWTISKSIYHSLIGQSPIEEIIFPVFPARLKSNLYICPASSDLTGAEIELMDIDQREWKLKQLISDIVNEYEFIFLDCPPSLGLLTLNSLTAAHTVLIPVQCEYYAMEGLSQLDKTISLIKRELNPDLEIEGYLLTMFDPRNKLAHVVVNEVREYFKQLTYDTVIPRSVRLAECPSHGLPVLMYDEKSPGARSYVSLAKEFELRNRESRS